MDVVEELCVLGATGVLGSEALVVFELEPPSVLSLHPVYLLAFNTPHHPEQFHHLPLLLGVRANAHHQSSTSHAPYGPMHDDRGDFDGRNIFVHESFNLADFRTPQFLAAVLRSWVLVTRGMMILAI